jgi:hypothetical protein
LSFVNLCPSLPLAPENGLGDLLTLALRATISPSPGPSGRLALGERIKR